MADDNNQNGRRVIGSTAEVKITSLPSTIPVLKGKTDTGATISSLHADNININKENGTVSFTLGNHDGTPLSDKKFTTNLEDMQNVRSAEATDYRPVVALNVKIDDIPLKDVLFNLNDRSTMEHPILIGSNILEKGNFLIDPAVNEEMEIDFDTREQVDGENDGEGEEEHDKGAVVSQVVDLMINNDITLEEIALHKAQRQTEAV